MEVSDASGGSDFTLEPASLTIGDTGTATGRVRVGTTGAFGTRTPVEIKISDSNTGYTFNPQMVAVPIVDVPAATAISLGIPVPVNEGENVMLSIGTVTGPSVDLVIGVSVADLANRGDYITEATHYVILGDGESSVNLTVPTQDVDGASLDGVLSGHDSVGYWV